jgi:hypothetical protein
VKTNVENALAVVNDLRKQLRWAATNLQFIHRAEAAGEAVLTVRDSAALVVRLSRLNDRVEEIVSRIEETAAAVDYLVGPGGHQADGAARAED